MNSKIKEEYINSKYTNATTIYNQSRIFGRASKFETKKGKDLAMLTHDEVIEMYKSMNMSKIKEIERCNRLYKKYTSFCIDKNYFPQLTENAYEKITKEEIIDCLVEENNELTNNIFRTFISDTINPVNKFLMQAAYEGLSLEEMMLAKYSDINGNIFTCHMVDENNNVVESRKLIVDNAFIQYAFESDNTYANYHIKNGKKVVDRGQYGEFIAKDGYPVEEGDMSEERLRSRREMIKKRFRVLSKNSDGCITYGKIRYLSMYNMICQAAQEMNVDPKKALTIDVVYQINKRFGIQQQSNMYLRMVEEHK